MNSSQHYPIGSTGQKWSDADKLAWLAMQSVKRSYQEQVLSKVLALGEQFTLEQYGALSCDEAKYPLYALKSHNWQPTKPIILVTGGVHGYETSGVQGAIRFMETKAQAYAEHFNIVLIPCVSPWGYETINRWNPGAIDPNRSFYQDSPAEESAAVLNYLASINADIFAHIDLHETTDTDNSEFRPALAARDAVVHDNWSIPDGFYLVGDTINPQPAFQKAMIAAVEQVTHIAPADDSGKLIGVKLAQFGVINYATKALGLCAGLSGATYVSTTEVYPDSPLVDDEKCIIAQVAAITGGLDYLLTL
ncbi:peptidase [Shewanella sp. Choline-02u-19]|uniref:M14 family metallopeptidase n=1 Tax=unclassified Shewanella TaxID=196818 RepID=UPI000C323B1F|nr:MULTISPECIES: M14 family metallocarboxypeptidase [unclassified Shewanella]PKH59183.1 peptidase [Shewanella sp. Bg11-22]PKI27058.1 peptidase [Shewanella sp. Choline-02u-19]